MLILDEITYTIVVISLAVIALSGIYFLLYNVINTDDEEVEEEDSEEDLE